MSQFKEGAVHQLVNALENAGYTSDDLTKLRQSDLPGILLVARGQARIVPIEVEPLLELVGTVTVPATAERFIVRNRFVVNKCEEARPKISFAGSYFQEKFGNKIEEPAGENALSYHTLRRASVDNPILDELGGKEKAATTLAAIFSLMEKQGNGEDGVLLTDGRLNICYVPDAAGVVRAVGVYWFGAGWHVDALSVEGPYGWHAGRRFFSRNRLET